MVVYLIVLLDEQFKCDGWNRILEGMSALLGQQQVAPPWEFTDKQEF